MAEPTKANRLFVSATGMSVPRALWSPGLWLGGMLGLLLLVWDPHAESADPKRMLLLAASVGLLIVACYRHLHGTRPTVTWRELPTAVWPLLAWISLDGVRTYLADPSLLTAIHALSMRTAILGVALGVYLHASRATVLVVAQTAGLLTTLGLSLWAIGAALLGAQGMGIHAGIGNPNWLGLVLMVSVPLAIEWLYVHSDGNKRLLLVSGLFLLSIVALWHAHARVAWVALTIGLLVQVALNGQKRGYKALCAVGLMAVLLLAFGLDYRAARTQSNRPAKARVVASPSASSSLPAAPAASVEESSEVSVDTSLAGRVRISKIALRAARQALPWGSGPGTFAPQFLAAQGQELSQVSPKVAARTFLNATTAHNDHVEILLEGGIIGMGCWLAVLTLAALGCLRSKWPAGLAVLVGVAVASVGDSPLQLPSVALFLGLVVAGSARDGVAAGATEKVIFRRTLFAGLTLVLLLCANLLAAAGRTYLATRARVSAQMGSPTRRLETLKRATRLQPLDGVAHMDLGLTWMAAGDPANALRAFEKARTLFTDVSLELATGQSYLLLHRNEEARLRFDAARAFHPGNIRARLGLAESLRRLKRYPEALAEGQVALALSPGHPRVRMLLDRIEQQMGQDFLDGLPNELPDEMTDDPLDDLPE